MKICNSPLRYALLAVAALAFVACSDEPLAESADDPTALASERANAFFEEAFAEDLAARPQRQTALGIKDDYDRWDAFTEVQADADLARARRQLETLRLSIDPTELDAQTRLSYELFERNAEQRIEAHRWRHHTYPLNQMRGYQSSIPTFLVNMHRVADRSDAEAYIARLQGIGPLVEQVIEQLDIRVQAGITAPKFVYAYVIDDARNIIQGTPFTDNGEDSLLFGDFRGKLEALDLPAAESLALLAEAEAALREVVGPAYGRLIARAEALQGSASEDAGVWKLPDGDDFYAFQLARMTTTDMGADEIHQVGLDEVARIHDEMRDIMQTVGFEGSLEEFFEFMRTDPQFYYPDTDEGRETYLQGARDIIAAFTLRLDEVFNVTPEAPMEVRAVEPFRERSAGKAFYQRPSPDGTRPGVYYANLYRMSDMPIYQKEALAYHEGIPGHHMQIAIAQELDDIPSFRRFGGFTAYSEGWGLYSEYFPKEMGFYEDPYSDFGRLAMELWRAARLVVDSGLHARRWTREEAIAYLVLNTPNPPGDAAKAIERYIVMPGQATAYLVGMLRILEIREQARDALGDAFDIRDFHDAVLENGALPLDVLEEVVLARLGVN